MLVMDRNGKLPGECLTSLRSMLLLWGNPLRKDISMSAFQDRTGQRYARLRVLRHGGKYKTKHLWICLCDCGKETTVYGEKLSSGHTQSCGCLWTEAFQKLVQSNTTHGLSKTRIHRIWCGMLARCRNSNHPAYKDYGGRGITVCARWQESFENFFADMGAPPSLRHSLDRFPDNNGSYTPENCRWATQTEQGRNCRNNVLISYQGITRPLVEWAEIVGIDHSALRYRQDNGWTPEAILTTPSEQRHYLTYNGMTQTLIQWAQTVHIKPSTLCQRIQYGWSDERVLTQPLQVHHKRNKST